MQNIEDVPIRITLLCAAVPLQVLKQFTLYFEQEEEDKAIHSKGRFFCIALYY